MDKNAIRADMLRRRSNLLPEQVVQMSRLAQRRLLSTALFAAVNSVALYRPIRNETATDDIFAAAVSQGKTVFFPRVEGETLHFVPIGSLDQLVAGSFGISEPPADLVVPDLMPDMILVPGVAFDRRGHRLGYGRGFYDRYLSACPAEVCKVGLSYSFQLCDAIPVDDHDQGLDALVTDAQTITWHNKVSG
ncbi:MAG: 5-formyltetrahydrofolate cyclo-ligase [Pelovirga sp.]